MNYKIKVIITNPNTEKDMVSELLFELDCRFHYYPDGYGKKTWLSITSEDGRFNNNYDLQYDQNFHRDKKEEFLEYWARNYWTGENGAWTIKSLEIIKA